MADPAELNFAWAPKGKPGGSSGADAVQVPAQKEFGKVFFTLAGTNYVCSGSSTVSANNGLVQTAGHCLNEGPGAFATNFTFVHFFSTSPKRS